jgi:nitroreductase
MELRDALRSTPATRSFTDEVVDEATLRAIIDDARFAPSGGNRQGWRVVVLEDPTIRRSLRDLYLKGWYEYLAQVAAGLTPFSPTNDRATEAQARANAPGMAELGAAAPGFAELLDEAPALLLVLADLSCLAAVDRDLDRYTLVGGGSIYPFVWNLLLGARDRGLGGVITTMPVLHEDEVLELVGAPADHVVAALVAIGRPVSEVRRLRRANVDEFTWVDRVGGRALAD